MASSSATKTARRLAGSREKLSISFCRRAVSDERPVEHRPGGTHSKLESSYPLEIARVQKRIEHLTTCNGWDSENNNFAANLLN